MLHVVSIEGLSQACYDYVDAELKSQLGMTERPKLFHAEELLFHEWRRQGVIVPVGMEDLRFPMKGLLDFVENNTGLSFQLWTRIKLSESVLRKFRKLEEEGKGAVKFTCYIISPITPTTDYKELERLIKISQNRPLGAEWISETDLSSTIERVRLSKNGLNYPIKVLAKISSADTQPLETPLSTMMRRYYSELKKREIIWYPKTYVHKAMDEEKWGVKPLSKNKQGSAKRHVLVTGTGRSGTTYFSDLLTQLGLDVGHQRNGKDGCSGAEFAKDYDWYPWFPVYGGGDCANVGERRSDYAYKHVLHIVRHPLWCIPSLMRNYPAINPEFWADSGVMDPTVMSQSSIQRNAMMYYSINKFIDESSQAE